jgi:exonuclease III
MEKYLFKYIKYKNKYNKSKINNLNGGSKLYTRNISTEYTKDIYDKLNKDDQNKFPFYCPNNRSKLCGIETPNYGLCKSEETECNNYTGENTYLEYDLDDEERKDNYNFGQKFGYDIYKHEKKDCSKLIVNSTYEANFLLPKKFKIMTYNCWWSIKKTSNETENDFHLKFFEIRMKNIAEIINKSDADIICLQEVGNLTFEILQPLLKENYKYYYENPFECNIDDNGPRGRSLETMCFSKYPVKSFKLFSVQGNLHYNNAMIMLEFDNLIIFNVYLQAGTRNSPGQKDLWFNYSRCRYNEYLAIGKYIKDNNIDKPMVVLGDFNTNLNGDFEEWPELKAFKQLKLVDSWLTKNDNNSGFTENTKVNYMRWNVKFEEKIYRIDGIFYTKDKLKTNQIEILGNEPIDIDKEMQQNFYDIRIPNKPNKDKLIRKNKKLQLWPSDHFAVMAELEFI